LCRAALTVAVSFAPLLSQEAAGSGTPPDTGGALRITAVGDANRGLATPVDLDADDAFLPSVLTTLSELSGYNIVTGPEVNRQQRISIHIKNTPVQEAINLVVRAAGLSYEIVGNSFLVTASENLEKEVGISSYLIELQYAKAKELKDLFANLTENIEVIESHNALLISTSPKVISEIRGVVERIDVPSKQVILQTRVVEVQVDRVKELGVDWEKLSKITTIIAERPSDPVLGSVGYPEAIDKSATDLGVLPGEHTWEKIDGLENVGKFDRQLTAFDITLDFLLKTNSAKLLTDAKLTTTNNRTASIHIGEIIPIIITANENPRIEREEIGVKVQITPQINDDGLITATVKPEVSTIVEMINGEIPRRKVRTAQTTVLVRDRQKIVIAGLLNAETSSDVHAVPWLGETPFVGRLFQHLREQNRTTDLIIEITPYILDNDDPLAQMHRDSIIDRQDPIDKYEELHKADSLRRQVIADTGRITGPTHLALMPLAGVVAPGHFSVGAHEVSVGLNNGFQFTFCPWQTIGRTFVSLKYGIAPRVAVAVGAHRGNYWSEEKYEESFDGGKNRLGIYGTVAIVDSRVLRWHVGLDGQFGERNSIGAATGLSLHFGEVMALMAEFTDSYTPATGEERALWDPWITGAVRLRVPWFKRLSIDAGVSMQADWYFVDPISKHPDDYTPMVYADIAYSGIFKERTR
jgi:type II secretory pathway component GspD/PulD (secretin)